MPKFHSYHGCFGRFAGDASHAYDFHLHEWTQVRNRKCKDDKKISNLLGSWNVIQDTRWVRNLEVAPETFAYLRTPAPVVWPLQALMWQPVFWRQCPLRITFPVRLLGSLPLGDLNPHCGSVGKWWTTCSRASRADTNDLSPFQIPDVEQRTRKKTKTTLWVALYFWIRTNLQP